MTDWKKIAEAQGLKLHVGDLAIAVSRLGALEERLRALLPSLLPEDDPAVVFELEAGRQ
jgi:hypothetical protein